MKVCALQSFATSAVNGFFFVRVYVQTKKLVKQRDSNSTTEYIARDNLSRNFINQTKQIKPFEI